jgi:hypothetical protein
MTPVAESNNPKDFPLYKKLSVAQYINSGIEFLKVVERHAKRRCFAWSDIRFNVNHISLIIDMVQRRRVYFYVFHAIAMGELNEACLKCFWILKLCPFFDPNNPQRNLNLYFALGIFTDAVRYAAYKKGKTSNLTHDVITHLKHAFMVRDLSKESLMAIAEGLVG